jgi:ABC-2 type transport system permease protein
MLLLRGVLEYYKTSEAAVIFSDDFLALISSIAESFIPCSYFANLMYGRKIVLSVILSIVITFIFGAISIYLAKRSYYPTLLKCLERGKEAFTKVTKNKPKNQFMAIFLTEMKLIFRSFSYSFQYLAMAIAAPVMVYFCNNLAVAVGDSSVGGAIVPGLTLMVVLIFDTIIVSFASTTVSRNGESFYLTKIFPAQYKLQISAKMALYLLVGGASTLVSCGISWAAFGGEKYGSYFGVADFFSIFFISLLIVAAMSAVAVLSDLKSPVFEVNGEGDLVKANKNMGGNMIMGIIVAVIYGLIAMIFTYLPMGALSMGVAGAYIVLGAFSVALTGGMLAWLFARTDKLYNNIVP